ncbi:MAG: hypothetical protein F6K09_16710, partial [Merismopedia sp. SIO2A8]|nr:hypothetical protein [Merismopedia sp. SIO2A8]
MNSKPPRLAKGSASQSPLARWVEFHERQLGLSIKGRFRGNSLHLLCELVEEPDRYPSQAQVHQHFEDAVGYAELNTLIPPGYPRIRHIWLYGRMKGAKKPAWSAPIHLNPVQRKGYDLKPFGALPEASPCEFSPPLSSEPKPVKSSSNRLQPTGHLPDQSPSPLPDPSPDNLYALAEQGHPQAIAYSLRESLINLGINAAIRVKQERNRPKSRKDRLWIICRAAYSPAATLVGEPIARQLRSLSLHNVEDAILQFQVNGEDTPDWVLRIDLTPQEEMLKDWARWGDVEAISRLVNQALQPLNSQLVEASLQGVTLHFHCAALIPEEPAGALGREPAEEFPKTTLEELAKTPIEDPFAEPLSGAQISPQNPSKPKTTATTTLLDVQRIRAKIGNTLKGLAPQGIHSAVIYGPVVHHQTPEWVEWITLPGQSQFDRGVSPLELATNGEVEAIAFLIRRVLNPELGEQLATGGIFVQVLHRKHLLHVMCDAPLCPAQDQVVEPVERLLRPLNIPGVKGLRLYGRRAGQRSPRWQSKIDFIQQPQVVPEPAPQFAATDAYVTELVDPSSEPAIREDLTPSELWSRWQQWKQRLVQGIRRSLLMSQFFVPTSDSPELMLQPTPRPAKLKTAMVWSAVGVLTLVQVYLGLNQLSRVFSNT